MPMLRSAVQIALGNVKDTWRKHDEETGQGCIEASAQNSLVFEQARCSPEAPVLGEVSEEDGVDRLMGDTELNPEERKLMEEMFRPFQEEIVFTLRRCRDCGETIGGAMTLQEDVLKYAQHAMTCKGLGGRRKT